MIFSKELINQFYRNTSKNFFILFLLVLDCLKTRNNWKQDGFLDEEGAKNQTESISIQNSDYSLLIELHNQLFMTEHKIIPFLLTFYHCFNKSNWKLLFLRFVFSKRNKFFKLNQWLTSTKNMSDKEILKYCKEFTKIYSDPQFLWHLTTFLP